MRFGAQGSLSQGGRCFPASGLGDHQPQWWRWLQAGAPEGHRASCEVLFHHAAEALDQRRIDSDLKPNALLRDPERLLRGPVVP